MPCNACLAQIALSLAHQERTAKFTDTVQENAACSICGFVGYARDDFVSDAVRQQVIVDPLHLHVAAKDEQFATRFLEWNARL